MHCRSTIFLLICLLCSSTSDGVAQRGWFWQNPLPVGNNLLDVDFTSGLVGTAIDDAGLILRTTDGGSTWMRQSSGTTRTLRALCFSDAYNGTVVGDGGTILRTTNGGESWVSQNSGIYDELYGVSFTGRDTGTVVSYYGRILRTTDGGDIWMNLAFENTTYSSVSFAGPNAGIIVGSSGAIRQTTDGGLTWRAHASGTIHDLWEVFAIDEHTATAVGVGESIIRMNELPASLAQETDRAITAVEGSLIRVYPNPAMDEKITLEFTLEKASAVSYELFSDDGERISASVDAGACIEGIHTITIATDRLPAATYTVRLLTVQGLQTRRFVIMR